WREKSSTWTAPSAATTFRRRGARAGSRVIQLDHQTGKRTYPFLCNCCAKCSPPSGVGCAFTKGQNHARKRKRKGKCKCRCPLALGTISSAPLRPPLSGPCHRLPGVANGTDRLYLEGTAEWPPPPSATASQRKGGNVQQSTTCSVTEGES